MSLGPRPTGSSEKSEAGKVCREEKVGTSCGCAGERGELREMSRWEGLNVAIWAESLDVTRTETLVINLYVLIVVGRS